MMQPHGKSANGRIGNNFWSPKVARWHFFQTKNPNLFKFLEGLAFEDVGIFNGHLVYFTAI
jgi:hypothetical protein